MGKDLMKLGANDELRLSYEATLGIDAAGSIITCTLENLTQGENTSDTAVMSEQMYAALTTGDGVGFAMQAPEFSANGSGVSGITVESIGIIPDPATLGLVGF